MPNMVRAVSLSRSQFEAERHSRYCLKRLVASIILAIEGHIITDNDDSDTRENKLAVFLACVALSLRGLTWGVMYVFLGAYWSCISPFLLVLTNCCGLLHMCITKRMGKARHIMVCSLVFCSLYVHWSLAGQSGTVYTWSLLAPQLLVLTGGTIAMSFSIFMVSATSLIALNVLRCTGQLSGFTPQGAMLSDDWIAIFEVLNVLFPAFMSSLLIWLTVDRMRKHRGQLERSVTKAEVIGQMIVDFDLDSINTIAEMKDDLVVHILKQVAFNLRLYRPFIPSHLLKYNASDNRETPTEDHSPVTCSPILPLTPMSPDTFICDLQTPRHGGLAPIHVTAAPPERSIRAPGGVFEVAHQMRMGSLLYVQLHQLEAYAKHPVHPDKLDRIHRTSSLFVEIVTEALKETHGVLQNIEHNACLVSWNFISTCRMHAENACHAALMIRDGLKMASGRSDLAPLTVSMGLWSGFLVSGSFGTPELKSQGVIGYGVRRVMDLQYYAAMNQYAIVASAEVSHLTSITPKVKLVPIDIASTRNYESARDLRHPSPSADTEILYEVVSLLPVTDDEWMYQLQEATGLCNPVQTLERLLLQMRDGLDDVPSFQTELSKLLRSSDAPVAAVAAKLDTLRRQGALDYPRYSQLCHLWVRPSSLHQGPSLPSPASHPVTQTSVFTSSVSRRTSYCSLIGDCNTSNGDTVAPVRRVSVSTRSIIFSTSTIHHPVPISPRSTGAW